MINGRAWLRGSGLQHENDEEKKLDNVKLEQPAFMDWGKVYDSVNKNDPWKVLGIYGVGGM